MPVSAVQQSYTHLYIKKYIFFSIMIYPRRLDVARVQCSRTLLFIHSKCNSLHLPPLNSQSIPPPLPLPLVNHESDLCVCEPVSVCR